MCILRQFYKFIQYFEARYGRPRLSIWRTLYVNFRTQPFSEAIRIHIRIYGKVQLACLDGKIEMTKNNGGKLYIGRNGAGYVNTSPGRIALASGAVLKVGQDVRFSQGCNIFIGKNAYCEFGDNSTMGDNAKIICYNYIKIGQHSDLTWESQAMDFNSHFIMDCESKSVFPIIKKVIIGDYCWVGNRTSIMPGTILPNRIIVASNSLLNKDYSEVFSENSLVGGIPAKTIRNGVRRIYDINMEQRLKNSLCQVQRQ